MAGKGRRLLWFHFIAKREDTEYLGKRKQSGQLRHMAGHPVPHAFYTYVGYVLAQGNYCTQYQGQGRKVNYSMIE